MSLFFNKVDHIQSIKGGSLSVDQVDQFLVDIRIDHHDDAINWAKNRVFEIDQKTSLIHFWNLDEKVLAHSKQQGTFAFDDSIFKNYSDKDLKLCGIPMSLLPAIRSIKDEKELESLEGHVSAEIYEALFCLAAGYSVEQTINEVISDEAKACDPVDYVTALLNPRNKRQLTVLQTADELTAMLEEPMEKWRVFLHPTQERLSHARFSGPALVTGGPGTGKTVVAMHRANYLANQITTDGKRILFTTFSSTLAQNIKTNLARLCPPAVLEKIEITHLHSWATRFLQQQGLRFGIPTEKQLLECWEEAVKEASSEKWEVRFCREEWETVIQHHDHGIESLGQYLAVVREGRGIALNTDDRKEIYKIFTSFIGAKQRRNFFEWNDVLDQARKLIPKVALPYTGIIVDEAQDMEPAAFRLLRAMVPVQENDLFIVGDVHQRIYKRPTVLSHCGIMVRGQTRNLKLNYRTTAQIGKWAINMLHGAKQVDFDGEKSDLRGYRSLLKGAEPIIRNFLLSRTSWNFWWKT